MQIHFHSFWAGAIVFALLLGLRLSVFWGWIGIVTVILTERYQYDDKKKRGEGADRFALEVVCQSVGMFVVYVAARFWIFGSLGEIWSLNLPPS
jgi:hypothetical protein